MRKDKTQAANDLKSQNHNTGKFPRTGGHSWSQVIDWIKKKEKEKLALQPEKRINIEESLLEVQREGKDCHKWVRTPLQMSQPCTRHFRSHTSHAVGGLCIGIIAFAMMDLLLSPPGKMDLVSHQEWQSEQVEQAPRTSSDPSQLYLKDIYLNDTDCSINSNSLFPFAALKRECLTGQSVVFQIIDSQRATAKT